jgi:hypothetical protein
MKTGSFVSAGPMPLCSLRAALPKRILEDSFISFLKNLF